MQLLATSLKLPGCDKVFRGESRDIYSIDDLLISVATDRLNVFGHIFPEPVPYKGQVLNQLSAYFMEQCKDIVPVWLRSVPDPNVSIGINCQPFKSNIVIRGCLTGHAWRVYQSGVRRLCGIDLPEGMTENYIFDEPIVTPTTKAPSGYEEDISGAELVQQGIMSESEFERISILARQLFIRGKQIARSRGLFLADAKYEFGKFGNEIYLIDELHTPDTARYFDLNDIESWEEGRPLQQLSKEFIRKWLLEKGYSGLEDQHIPSIDKTTISELSNIYVSLYEKLTGNRFEPADETISPQTRIEDAISKHI